MNFVKFRIEKEKWWKTSSYDIYDENHDICYVVKSKLGLFSYTSFLTSTLNNLEYRIEKTSKLAYVFDVYENDYLIGSIERISSFNKTKISIVSNIVEPFEIHGGIWKKDYTFIRGEQEIGKASYEVWKNGRFGIAIKEGEHVPISLSAIIVILYLKGIGVS